jgi:hypothetical protein
MLLDTENPNATKPRLGLASLRRNVNVASITGTVNVAVQGTVPVDLKVAATIVPNLLKPKKRKPFNGLPALRCCRGLTPRNCFPPS